MIVIISLVIIDVVASIALIVESRNRWDAVIHPLSRDPKYIAKLEKLYRDAAEQMKLAETTNGKWVITGETENGLSGYPLKEK